ncbi:ABC transporter ATP-binding protein [Winogradskyella haliclonae]|uniref:ABC transporter ATP-binding protein n=1 Tax=Winogradskyella haliclonae TaxID=2048558 RepID=A0ABQ2C1W7_9FLAO|nr:ABC transporter ATP-binding protein [Winogradskyella haliclonae]GGI58048.1 ABC transporter ATP-binding protein [Winogradskyella haliclonae]
MEKTNVILKVEDISKQYRLGVVGTGTIGDDLKRWWYKVRGKEDPFLKVGDVNDRSQKSESDYVWAIKDINFQVRQGEVLGIIGKNGAGKSTLLKILSRVTAPTTGEIKTKGRIASLLEVGTGFHHELTGRENIYLNGAILGMTKAEITEKIDEIISFSGCERYIDTPVKRYSSGMTVRLAFAVAAFLEPDILVIDEVLAVGDAEFQRKAVGKMQDISKGEGRTVLFVSHNMTAVKGLCTRAIVLEHGNIAFEGATNDAVDFYLSNSNDLLSSEVTINEEKDGFTVESLKISNNGVDGSFNIYEDLMFDILIDCKKEQNLININIFLNSIDAITIFATCSEQEKQETGKYIYQCIIPKGTLNNIMYNIDIMVVENGEKALLNLKNVTTIEGNEEDRDGAWLGKYPGLLRPQNFQWKKIKL